MSTTKLVTASPLAAGNIVNLDAYPIEDPQSAAARAVIAAGRAQLDREGLCLLPDFLTPRALDAMRGEARELYRGAYYEEQADTHDDSGRLSGTTMPRRARSAGAAVAYDRLAPSSALRLLYEWDGLLSVVGALLGMEPLYRTADPIISCLLMYYAEGDELGWHFDPNDGVVTLLLEAAEQGGEFEFVPDIGAGSRRRDAIAAIMDGRREGVLVPPLRPGTLSIFRGSNALHRVSPVRGPGLRTILTMSFDPEPGVMFSPEIRRRYSGRTH